MVIWYRLVRAGRQLFYFSLDIGPATGYFKGIKRLGDKMLSTADRKVRAAPEIRRSPFFGMGFGYKSNIRRKSTRGSSTAGITKDKRCRANHVQRHFAKDARAYKEHGYRAWCAKMDKYR